jgi:hypothetical protein
MRTRKRRRSPSNASSVLQLAAIQSTANISSTANKIPYKLSNQIVFTERRILLYSSSKNDKSNDVIKEWSLSYHPSKVKETRINKKFCLCRPHDGLSEPI